MGSDVKTAKAWDIALRIAMPVILLAGGGVIGLLLNVDRRVVAIESSRFTKEDGRIVVEQMQKQFTTIMVELRGLGAAMPKEIPPKWFLEKVDHLEDRIQVLEDK